MVLALGLAVEAPPAVYADEAKAGSGLSAFGGTETAGLMLQLANEEGRAAFYLGYQYDTHGVILTRARSLTFLVAKSHIASLQFREGMGLTLLTKGGTGIEAGGGWAMLGRLGTPGGGFSAVLGPSVGISGTAAVGDNGLSARFPVGAELGLEGRIGRIAPYLLLRPWADLWPGMHPVYRAELGLGIGLL
jgi:hypothetical protein